ncbi:phosphoprotein phosphatase [Schizosaccharomyces cryophilus OY26]|uniref:Phosphoprotein phosphatase n=1 Tax=Schizosaccharomyces cryophilus (strain OY26 / ATCC MYA-4695 / CBS 11777 / NBRC 106824 / NRRL Y48691) TaxID=653667 RepID=S9VTG5_SCHCR|nr:phosphoprotein phosphatase [Schizosaccharomyces cryophilus OY26]EPY51168.1 phosphoprotein phosphatase [Schizosaccharomyces cryophilus OY26]
MSRIPEIRQYPLLSLFRIFTFGLFFAFFIKYALANLNIDKVLNIRLPDVIPLFDNRNRNTEDFPVKVYAIGDIHGDFHNALDALSAAGVVSPVHPFEWTAGNATLVQTGDIVDRGPDTRFLFRWFDELSTQAERQGGRVIRLLGNHEFMNANGDWRYVHYGDLASYPEPSIENRKYDWGPEGEIGNLLITKYNVTFKDETSRSHFMHAGLSPEWSLMENFVNPMGHELLEMFMKAEELPDELKAFWGIKGPMWYRGYAQLPLELACEVASNVTKSLNVDRLVIGHTPQFEGIRSRCNGQVILIDTGLSTAYSGERAVLRILRNDEMTAVEAIYRDRVVKL